ncbi:MAG: hypothetical protein ACR2H3_00920 [Acidimicrobiales bacterium]
MRKLVAPIAIAGALATGGLAGAILGVPTLSGAQTDDGGSAETTTPAETKPSPWKSTLDGLVPGTITQDQADAVDQALRDARPDKGRKGHRGGGKHLDEAATALGMTPLELHTELRAGKTLAAIATEKEVDVNTVIDALVSAAEARIDAAVESGKLDRAKADEVKTNLRDKITTMVNEGPQHDGRGHKGPRGAADRDDAAATETAA